MKKKSLVANLMCLIGAMAVAITPNVALAATATSNVIALSVNDLPNISLQPVDVAVYGSNSESASFTITATGDAPLTYLWAGPSGPLVDGGRISGSATNTLTISNVVGGDAGNYVCVVTTFGGSGPNASSNIGVLSVYSLPSITIASTPASDGGMIIDMLTVNANDSVIFTATPTGGWGQTPTYTLTWESSPDGNTWTAVDLVTPQNGYTVSNSNGLTGNILTINPVSAEHGGLRYRCTVDDGHGA